MIPTIPFIYFLFCGISGLILWFRMLGILERKGHKVNYLWVSPQQYLNFFKVIKEETDLTLRKRYRVIFWTQIALVPAYIIGSFILIVLTI